MVVFTCNHCGESLQKPRVEKHYFTVCKRPKSLTCVDCLKDYRNEEYVDHIKCITEEERYAAKGTYAGGIVKKGDTKQASWIEMIRSIVATEQDMEPSLRNLFNTISNYNNVPRKKVKFLNFLKNSTGGRVNFKDIEAAWDLIEKFKTKNNTCKYQNSQNGKKIENGVNHKTANTDEQPPKKKTKKESENGDDAGHLTETTSKKHSSEAESELTMSHEIQPTEPQDKFNFKGTILKILTKKSTISCKKLQKKVFNIYLKETRQTEYTEKTLKKYNKKLKKLPNVSIVDDNVTLIES